MGGWSKHDHLQNNYNDKDFNINISSLGPTICFREPGDNIVIDPLKLKKLTCRAELLSLRAWLPTQTAVSENTDRITANRSVLLQYTPLSLNILLHGFSFISSFSLNNYLIVPNTLIEYREEVVFTTIIKPSYGSCCIMRVQSLSFLI